MRMTMAGCGRVAGIVACLVLAGCVPGVPGGPTESPVPTGQGAVPTPEVTITHGYPAGDPSVHPPAFVVLYGSTRLELSPHTYCYHFATMGACADGYDNDPPSIGSPAQIVVYVPVTGMNELTVTQTIGTEDCATLSQTHQLGGGWWSVTPTGRSALYRVSLFASGSEAGDMVADLLWQTAGGAKDAPSVRTCGR